MSSVAVNIHNLLNNIWFEIDLDYAVLVVLSMCFFQ